MSRFVLLLLALQACGTDRKAGPDGSLTPDGTIAPDASEPAHGRATGQLDPWKPGPSLPTARANHCTAAIGDWVLVIGGNHQQGTGFVKTAEIHAAKMGADGTLGPWQLAGHTHSPVSECNATGAGRTLYVVDGLYDVDADSRQIWAADLDADGHLADLTSRGRLPDGQIAISSEVAVAHDQLMLMDTRLPNEGDTTVTMRTPTTSIAWSTDDWHIGFRAQAQYAFAASYVYTLGGYKGDASNTVTTETFAAPIGSDGVVGAPVPTTALPTPTAFGEAVAVDDFVFVAGGRSAVFGAPGTTNVVAAAIGATGSLGAWSTVASLPAARTNHKLALVGDYLVLTGGANNGPGDAMVVTARVRFPTE